MDEMHQSAYEREIRVEAEGENRANDTLRDTRQSTPIEITLMQIDGTIFKHLAEFIKPTVMHDEKQVLVPVRYANAERWKQVREDGVLRDGAGRVQTPIILFRRTGIRRNALTNPVNKHLDRTYQTGWNKNNIYDKFSALNRMIPSRELVSVTIPDYVDLTYDFLLWTDYIEQMNPLIETLNFEMDSYWGQRGEFKFKVRVEDYTIETDVPAVGDRYVKATFQMKVNAYLLPETMMTIDKGIQPTDRLRYSKKKVVVIQEIDGTNVAPRRVVERSSGLAGSTAITSSVSILDADAIISGAGLFYLPEAGSQEDWRDLIDNNDLEPNNFSEELNPPRYDFGGAGGNGTGPATTATSDMFDQTSSLPDNQHTIFIVVKPHALNNGSSILSYKEGGRGVVFVKFDNMDFEYIVTGSVVTGDDPAVGMTIDADVGAWQSIAFTVGPDGGAKQRSFKNGQLNAIVSKNFDLDISAGSRGMAVGFDPFHFVGIGGQDEGEFSGSIGYMGWWPRELSPAEISIIHSWMIVSGGFEGFLT